MTLKKTENVKVNLLIIYIISILFREKGHTSTCNTIGVFDKRSIPRWTSFVSTALWKYEDLVMRSTIRIILRRDGKTGCKFTGLKYKNNLFKTTKINKSLQSKSYYYYYYWLEYYWNIKIKKSVKWNELCSTYCITRISV